MCTIRTKRAVTFAREGNSTASKRQQHDPRAVVKFLNNVVTNRPIIVEMLQDWFLACGGCETSTLDCATPHRTPVRNNAIADYKVVEVPRQILILRRNIGR